VVFRISILEILDTPPPEASFSSVNFLILQYRFEGKTEYLLITNETMLTLREQLRWVANEVARNI
jgi:hypothetical protein